LMGSDFDRDPLFPWAAEILNDRYHPPNERIMRLTGRANQFLVRVQQRESGYFKKVLAASRSNVFKHLPDTIDPSATRRAILDEIKKTFPAKLECVGESNTERLILRGLEDARGQGIQDPSGRAAFVFFMFMHGVHFYRDPKYPQASAIFSDDNLTGS